MAVRLSRVRASVRSAGATRSSPVRARTADGRRAITAAWSDTSSRGGVRSRAPSAATSSARTSRGRSPHGRTRSSMRRERLTDAGGFRDASPVGGGISRRWLSVTATARGRLGVSRRGPHDARSSAHATRGRRDCMAQSLRGPVAGKNSTPSSRAASVRSATSRRGPRR